MTIKEIEEKFESGNYIVVYKGSMSEEWKIDDSPFFGEVRRVLIHKKDKDILDAYLKDNSVEIYIIMEACKPWKVKNFIEEYSENKNYSIGQKFNMDFDKLTQYNAKNKQIGGEHYKNKKLQPWDIIDALGLNFYEGNALKYLLRYKEKNGVEDLQKSIHYIEKLIEDIKGE